MARLAMEREVVSDTPARITTELLARGAAGGVAGAVLMAMVAMIAGATYQGTGFFTPMYHIAHSVWQNDAMMRSMEAAKAGSTFTFEAGPAALGMMLHLATGVFWGVVLVAIVRRPFGSRGAGIGWGALYGLAVMAVMSLAALPVLAEVLGGGDPIAKMPSMVGWSTFTVEHLLYGAVLGLVLSGRAVTRLERG